MHAAIELRRANQNIQKSLEVETCVPTPESLPNVSCSFHVSRGGVRTDGDDDKKAHALPFSMATRPIHASSFEVSSPNVKYT